MASRSGRMITSALVAVLVAACGGGAPSTDPTAGATGGPEAPGEGDTTASLQVLDTTVDRAIGSEEYAQASSGDRLAVGDRLRTDPTGFGEVAYLDGSLARLGPDTTLTLLALSDEPDVVDTEVDLEAGALWNRVTGVTEAGGRYDVRTPVGVASVRGTVFAIVCRDDVCVFTVLEGELEVTLTLPGGAPVELGAMERVEVTAGQPAPAPEAITPDEVAADPWLADNLALDGGEVQPPAPETPTGTAAGALADARVEGAYAVTATIVEEEGNLPDVDVGDVADWDWEITPDCDRGPCSGLLRQTTAGGSIDFTLTFDGVDYSGEWHDALACFTQDDVVTGRRDHGAFVSFRVAEAEAVSVDALATALEGELRSVVDTSEEAVAAGCADEDQETVYEIVAEAGEP